MFLIYAYQCDKSTTKANFLLQLSCIELSKNVQKSVHVYYLIIVGVYHG